LKSEEVWLSQPGRGGSGETGAVYEMERGENTLLPRTTETFSGADPNAKRSGQQEPFARAHGVVPLVQSFPNTIHQLLTKNNRQTTAGIKEFLAVMALFA